jgi:DNA polymerase III delta prime subunit
MPQTAPVPVLDADSSQLQAMMLATAGRHVVIHGPPGTGKSQTISNVIAEALGRGQKVLFVSAKMAALNVVYDRLNKLSLGHFCLEAHSTKAGKARIIDDLRRTLEREPITQDNRLEAQIESLKQVRTRLNKYVRALHKRLEPLELTVYEAIGKVAKLSSEPDILGPLPWADPLRVSNPDMQQVLTLLDDFAVLANVFDRRSEHPWAGIEPAPGEPLQALTLQTWLTSLARGLEATAQALSGLDSFVPHGHDPSFQQVGRVAPALRALSQVDRLPDNWWQTPAERLKEESGFFADAATMAKEFRAKESECCLLFDIGWCEAATLLEPIKGTFARWYRRITPSYWTWRSAIRARLKPDAKSNSHSLLRYYRLASGREVWESLGTACNGGAKESV